jgi:hypothetical protein
MNLDFKEISKQGFECLQFDDGAIYFGELVWRNSETGHLVYNYDDLTEEEQAKCAKVRQGYGIQLFGRTEDSDLLCKFSGQWAND